MAISINTRPRVFYYNTDDSPAVAVYSNWCAAWNPIVYGFAVASADLASYLIISIYEVGTNTLLSESTYRPFKVGTWNVDIAPSIRSYLFSAFETDFSDNDNCNDAGNALSFYITYTQVYENGDPQVFNSEQTRPIIASCSAMQFGDSYGGNMAKYTPFNFDLEEAKKMKFLTAFEKPVMWYGYPISLSFIYATSLIGVELIKREVQQDVNGASLTTDDKVLDPYKIGKVNYLKINEPNQQYAQSVKVSLRTGDSIPNYYVEDGYIDDGYTQIN